MKKIAITGSIASGKSTVAKLLRSNTTPIFDADLVVKNLYKEKIFLKSLSRILKHRIRSKQDIRKLLRSKKIKLIKANALKYLRSSKQKFDLILIKQSIHFFNLKEVRQLILYAKKILNKNGRIVIFSLNTKVNEWPKFKSFRDKLKKSLKKDEKIIKLLKSNFKKFKTSQFIYKVHLDKKYYLKMLKNRFTSCLLNFSNKELSEGIEEVDHNFKNKINFKDRLICLTFKNK